MVCRLSYCTSSGIIISIGKYVGQKPIVNTLTDNSILLLVTLLLDALVLDCRCYRNTQRTEQIQL